ncbi:MAG: alpha-ketoglutarate-dependent dioxygenase AlkB [Planctomycetota bacterium]
METEHDPIEGFAHHDGALSPASQKQLLADLTAVMAAAPLYTPTMPRSGKQLSVRMTNCGLLGWLTDQVGGYRYQATHPETGQPWPPIPSKLLSIWQTYAPDAPPPEACLINAYAPSAKLGLHIDADEDDQTTPVISVSLGADAWFRLGGLKRRDPTARYKLMSGDIVVLGGPARRAYHGVDRIIPDTSTLLEDMPGLPPTLQSGRINLTLRRVTIAETA